MPYLEHVGIAVAETSDVQEMFESLCSLRSYKQETVDDDHVRTTFISAGTSKLELLEATDPDSPIARYLERHREGIHHLAFEVDDIFEAMEKVRALGLDPLDESPRRGADGKQIFFLHPRQTHGILIEFCQDTSPPLEPVQITFRDGRLATYRAGRPTNPPIILLHGALGATDLETSGLLRELEKDFFVLGPDFPGHGESEPIEDLPLTRGALADAVRAVMDEADIERAKIFGFSFGGTIGLTLAHQSPSRVEHLVIHGANPFWTSDDTEVFFDPERIAREQPGWAQRLDLTHGARRWQRLCNRIIQGARSVDGPLIPADELAHIHVPVLVTGGDRDSLTPLRDTIRLYEQLPESQLSILPGTRHPFQQIDIRMYGRLIRTFTNHEAQT